MINILKQCIKKNKYLYQICLKFFYLYQNFILYLKTNRALNNIDACKKHIFYIGIPVHANLGDLAQGMCIRKWLKYHYGDYQVIEIETNALVNTKFSLLKKLKRLYSNDDFIVFQSGYTTTDLGGYADEMHRAVMKILPNAKMLMMPQTVFFKNENNKIRTSECYDKTERLLFLARDRVSYENAKEMFPHRKVLLFPDVVTMLIGSKVYDYERKGILICKRNDVEQFYKEDEIISLKEYCEKYDFVEITDTTKNSKDIVKNAEQYVLNEIDCYAHYKMVITDRFHGTIFSLIAGTPVIVLKSSDHKVIAGAEWFENIYHEYIFVSKSIKNACELVDKIEKKTYSYKLVSDGTLWEVQTAL